MIHYLHEKRAENITFYIKNEFKNEEFFFRFPFHVFNGKKRFVL